MRKIFFGLLIVLAVAVSLTAVSAFDDSGAIDIGDITTTTIEVNDFDESTMDLDFKSNVEVDISDLSNKDRKLLEDAIKDSGTSYILNLTCGSGIKIALWTYDGFDAHIDGNTLYIENDHQMYTLDPGFGPEDLEINAVTFNTTDGQLLSSVLGD